MQTVCSLADKVLIWNNQRTCTAVTMPAWALNLSFRCLHVDTSNQHSQLRPRERKVSTLRDTVTWPNTTAAPKIARTLNDTFLWHWRSMWTWPNWERLALMIFQRKPIQFCIWNPDFPFYVNSQQWVCLSRCAPNGRQSLRPLNVAGAQIW